MIKNLLFVIFTFGLVSCALHKKDYYQHITPPNGIKIGENHFYDQTEVRNIDWREYMWWTQRIYGAKSDEYLASIPDTNVWADKDSCLKSQMRLYLYLRKFEEFPVVGISQKQAEIYSKWRSDRVFEYILRKYGKLIIDTAQKRETCFSIERYLSGLYHNQKPDPNFKYYPQYRLPTTQEWKKAMHYADSVEQAYLQKHNSECCKELKRNWPEFQSDIIPCLNDSFKVYPIRIVNSGFVPRRKSPIYNLRGNLSEWTSENNLSAGGSWINNRKTILTTDTFQSKTKNAWTGFRNVCEWKEFSSFNSR